METPEQEAHLRRMGVDQAQGWRYGRTMSTVTARPGPREEPTHPGGHRFVDATQVAEIYERGVVLAVDAAGAEALPKPSANPAQVEVGPDDVVPDELHDKLRRAWDRISGKA